MTDEALMFEVSKNNIESASMLYERYSKRLYNYFVKISFDRESGYDLMQSTFLRMIKYRHTYQEGRTFQTWIFQIARNVFADHLKKDKLLINKHIDVYHVDKTSCEDEASSLEQKERNLHLAMAKLPDESREILVLSRFQDLKYDQIASLLNLTVPAVKVKVHRAIKKLRMHYVEIAKI